MDSLLFGLIALACPVGMGLMMWFVAKGIHRAQRDRDAPRGLEELRAEQRRLGAEIERLEDDSGPSFVEAPR